MLKDFLLVKAAPSVTKDQVRKYLQFSHAPLALSTAEIGRSMQRYTMNHLVDAPNNVCLYSAPDNLTTVVEHSLVGGADKVSTIMADPEYVEKVVPDEKHMIENLMDGMPQFIAVEGEETVFGGKPESSMRMFEFLRCADGVLRDDFFRMLKEEGAWASENPRYSKAVEKRVHSTTGSGPLPVGAKSDAPLATYEPFDAVVEVWISDPEELSGLLAEISNIRARYCDPDRSVSALTEENKLRG